MTPGRKCLQGSRGWQRRRLTPVGWREELGSSAGRSQRRNRGGFDKGTLAMAQIELMRPGQKPARSPGKRTGHRPLSNPPLWPLQLTRRRH
jgi:hypothetical protein